MNESTITSIRGKNTRKPKGLKYTYVKGMKIQERLRKIRLSTYKK